MDAEHTDIEADAASTTGGRGSICLRKHHIRGLVYNGDNPFVNGERKLKESTINNRSVRAPPGTIRHELQRTNNFHTDTYLWGGLGQLE